MNEHLIDVLLLFLIEVAESNLQRGKTFNDLVNNLYLLKMNHPLGFWLLSSSFLFVTYFLVHGIGSAFVLGGILALKAADISLKFKLIKHITQDNCEFNVTQTLGVPNFPITPALRYSGALVYTTLFFWALSIPAQ
ncbi:MAG: hypothetical protein LBE89_08315 [Helicobacteraceae bacterium]|jgi:hypothetical protein|nr:hypothetical protein [Helicobacteraceae bacterium]